MITCIEKEGEQQIDSSLTYMQTSFWNDDEKKKLLKEKSLLEEEEVTIKQQKRLPRRETQFLQIIFLQVIMHTWRQHDFNCQKESQKWDDDDDKLISFPLFVSTARAQQQKLGLTIF